VISARKVALDKTKEIAKVVRSGAYFVKRGAINWTTWGWDKYPRAISIQLDDTTLFQINGINEGTLTLEMFARMKTSKEVPEIEDAIMDELLQDAEEILVGLMDAKDSSGNAVILKLDENTARAVESHDTTLRVQGIVVTVSVSY